MKVLANFLQNSGANVTGSDIKLTGHNKENVVGADLVVYTCAIACDNEELSQAKKLGIKTMERGELLAKFASLYKKVISISGSHGKTTTTSLIGKVLSPLSPCVHAGEESNCIFSDKKELFITEACEYKQHFLLLHSHIGIILNTDYEHVDCYDSEMSLVKAYQKFADNSFITLINGDDKNAKYFIGDKILKFGFDKTNDFYVDNVTFDCKNRYSFSVYYHGDRLGCFDTKLTGKHNVYNSLCAIIVGFILGLDYYSIYQNLLSFNGVKRRFEYLLSINNVPIFTDYAHHPNEINALYLSVKQMGYKRIIIVFEPHTYSRTIYFKEDFIKVLSNFDLIVLPPIYSAREIDNNTISSRDLANALRKIGKSAYYVKSYNKARTLITKTIKNGDIVLLVGAGNINTLFK